MKPASLFLLYALPVKDLIIEGEIANPGKVDFSSGMLCLTGIDGYRCAFSYSEVFNRNDQQEFLLITTKPDEEGGLYRVFAACDFFSDRAVKSLSEVHLGY